MLADERMLVVTCNESPCYGKTISLITKNVSLLIGIGNSAKNASPQRFPDYDYVSKRPKSLISL